jgi:hypothetical protein
MQFITGFFFFPLLVIVSLGKMFAWILINFWWALILFYLYAVYKHHKNAPK